MNDITLQSISTPYWLNIYFYCYGVERSNSKYIYRKWSMICSLTLLQPRTMILPGVLLVSIMHTKSSEFRQLALCPVASCVGAGRAVGLAV